MENRLEAAQRLINKFGFIVVPFKTEKPMGFTTSQLWGVRTPYRFTIIGIATLEDWQRQMPIAEAIEPGVSRGKEDPAREGFPFIYKLMTD